jgi:large subunit ribosomal protein L32
MAVPKQRHTRSRRNKRRLHIFAKVPTLTKCPKCGKPVLPHTICWNCGYYKGKEVINVLEKLTKKERKKREKEMAAKEKEEKKEKPLSWEELSKK